MDKSRIVNSSRVSVKCGCGEWHWLKSAMVHSPERHGMSAAERVLLYETAIQTGLRSSELRSLTRGQCRVQPRGPMTSLSKPLQREQ